MPSFCAVANCELKYSHSEDVSFHKFPLKSPQILAKWIKFTNRGPDWKPSRWNSICSRHFDKSDFREYLSRKCLKKEAIPTIVTKSNISYETYHISNGSPDDTRTECNQSEQDYEVRLDSGKPTSETMTEMCRLCGERAENLTCNPQRSLDDPEIDLLCRKCLPTVNFNNICGEHSRTICTDCVAQLKQYSAYIDRILSYQRELDLNENFDSYATSENHLTNGSQNQDGAKSSTPAAHTALFIKQEPINVKQEKIDSSNRRPFTTHVPKMSPSLCLNPFAESKKVVNLVHQEIALPKTEMASTYCRACNHIFANSNEFQWHECSNGDQNTDREQGNNCETMEVITLNNPISFIDLAEDENVTNTEPRKPKPENLSEFERRERLEFEHAYAKRITNTSCNLKQEITDSYNDASQNGCDYTEHDEQVFNQSGYFDESEQIYYDCVKCNQLFVSQELLDEHVANFHPLKHKICSICNAEFKSSYEYLIHKSKVHTQRFQCKQCKQKFNTQSILRFHERVCTRESHDFCFSCRRCGKSIRNLAAMKKHLNNCERKIEPIDAQQSKMASSEHRHGFRLKDLSENKEKPDNQPVEKVEIESNTAVPLPLLNYDDGESTKQSFKFIIDDSKFIFLNESKSTPTALNDTIDNSLNGKFACDTCGQPFNSFIHLKQHKMEHDSERKFNCSLCPKTFRGISGLKQHISGFHYKIKPYSCSVCHYAYALKGDMQRCRHSKLKNQTNFKTL